MKKTIVYILSTNYSGSTMLNLMLGAHSRVLQIGEAKRLRRINHKQEVCALCKTGRPCSLFEDITPDNVNALYDILFRRNPDIDVIVDNSKRTDWCQRFKGLHDRYEIKYIHLLRDPRALLRRWYLSFGENPKVVQRWKLMRKSADMILRAPFCDTSTLYTYKWLCQNRVISSYLRQQASMPLLLTYHDLVTDTENQLNRISEFLGIETQAQQMQYWTTQQHASGKTSELLTVAGISLDLRWQESLSVQQNQTVVNNPLVRDYLNGLGIRMQDDGLTLYK